MKQFTPGRKKIKYCHFLQFLVSSQFQDTVYIDPGASPLSIMYVGMFAGASKPNLFQLKRPNLLTLASGKLPSLSDMRRDALQLNTGSYRARTPGESRRIQLAIQASLLCDFSQLSRK